MRFLNSLCIFIILVTSSLACQSKSVNQSASQNKNQTKMEPVTRSTCHSPSRLSTRSTGRGRRMVVARHGERLDWVFGRDQWIPKSFNAEGKYVKQNLNMPDFLFEKAGSPASYAKDTPLTQIGLLQGFLVGKGIRQQNILRPGFITVTSPALRCIHTAHQIIQGFNSIQTHPDNSDTNTTTTTAVPIKIDLGLHEWVGYDTYRTGLPQYMTVDELTTAGFNIDRNYTPYLTRDTFQLNETRVNLYNRYWEFVNHLLNAGWSQGKDLLLVGHAVTLDAVTHRLVTDDKESRSEEEIERINHGIPFAGVAIVEEIQGVEGVEGQREGRTDKTSWVFKDPGPIQIQSFAINPFRADQHFCGKE